MLNHADINDPLKHFFKIMKYTAFLAGFLSLWMVAGAIYLQFNNSMCYNLLLCWSTFNIDAGLFTSFTSLFEWFYAMQSFSIIIFVGSFLFDLIFAKIVYPLILWWNRYNAWRKVPNLWETEVWSFTRDAENTRM